MKSSDPDGLNVVESADNVYRIALSNHSDPSCEAGKYPLANTTAVKDSACVWSESELGSLHIEPSHTSS